MVTKKLYTASIELELMVVADSPAEACKVAARALNREIDNMSIGPLDFRVDLSRHLVEGWEEDALPYGDEGSGSGGNRRTVGAYLAQQIMQRGTEDT